jgi:hypothetical protein
MQATGLERRHKAGRINMAGEWGVEGGGRRSLGKTDRSGGLFGTHTNGTGKRISDYVNHVICVSVQGHCIFSNHILPL